MQPSWSRWIGGGTIDVSTYKQKNSSSHNFQEIAAPKCMYSPSVSIFSLNTQRQATSGAPSLWQQIYAKDLLEGDLILLYFLLEFSYHLPDLLSESRFSDDVPHNARCFNETTKVRFRNLNDPQFIKFDGVRDLDAKLGIRSGQIKILGYVWTSGTLEIPNEWSAL